MNTDDRVLLRRPRAAFDGQDPVFAVMSGKKIALSSDHNAWLIKQSLELADQSSSSIKATLRAMLESDKLGIEHPMEIAGLMRGKTPYDGRHKKSEIDAPESCDQCSRNLTEVGFFFDACTISNMEWSWMCPPCFFALGCGVGEGFGQLYLRQDGEAFLLLGG